MNIKKKILAGFLSGALVFSGGFYFNSAQANEPPESEQHEFNGRPDGRHERQQFTDEQLNDYAKRLAEYYGLEQSEIAEALKKHVHLEDVRNAATLAKLSGKSFSEVLAMRVDWRQVAEKLGVTREQVEEFMKNERLEGLVQNSKLDRKTVESLLNEHYDPRDITVAGIIANASGKNVKSVLAKRKINNGWDEVAKEFGVDLQKLIKPNHERGNGRDNQR